MKGGSTEPPSTQTTTPIASIRQRLASIVDRELEKMERGEIDQLSAQHNEMLHQLLQFSNRQNRHPVTQQDNRKQGNRQRGSQQYFQYKIPLRDVASLNFRGCHMLRRGSTGVPILRVYMSLLHSPAHGRTPSCDKVVPAATKLQYCYWFPSAAAVPQALSAHQSLWRDDWACIPAQTLDLLGAA